MFLDEHSLAPFGDAGSRRFFIQQRTGTDVGRKRTVKSIIGKLSLSEKQAQKLQVKSYQRISPYLTECYLRASANVSYGSAAQDVASYTGMIVSARTQQRLVHRYQFPEADCESLVAEISVDGGKVRLRTETKGESCIWRDYKAVCIHSQSRMAWFQKNEELVQWVNQQPFDFVLNCVGDDHPGIWNLMNQFNPEGESRQILDWFHLVENLYKVGGSLKRLAEAKQLLWQGKVDAALALFSPLKKTQAQNFCTYLSNHRHRIVNYDYYQAENICAIAQRVAQIVVSRRLGRICVRGAVESTVKQIDRRLKISGAQWKIENVPQVLKHRCAYLNNSLSV